ncbi:ROK family protein [Aliikangiella maris]|uniref:ROK family protein n=2 Tax=Aliikangiella maris TaxID=3162458 RepID=A0ABV2BPR5_9GAMM
MKKTTYHIGIDLGGTKIEIVALDAKGQLLFKKRIDTPQNNYALTLQSIVRLIHMLETQLGGQGTIGIGTPGSPSQQTHLMKNCNSTCLNGKPLQQDLQKMLGRSIRLANDANCFALSEATDGAGTNADSVFGVILGTGVGGGLVINGRLHLGVNQIAGEWGHNLMPAPAINQQQSRACYCGRTNCVETFLSGPGLAFTFRELGGTNLSASAIAAKAEQGDSLANKCLTIYFKQLAFALAQVVNVFDPSVIVLGGGVSNIKSLYEQVPRYWQPHIFNDEVLTQLKPAKFGDSSGVRGAAWLWQS